MTGLTNRSALGALLAAWALSVPAPSAAQVIGDRILTPPTGLASGSNAYLVAWNPAAMAINTGWEIDYFHAETSGTQDLLPGTGDGLYATSPVFGPVHAGLGLEFLRPPRSYLLPHHEAGLTGASWVMATFAVAFDLGRILSIGTDIRTWFSPADHERMNGLVSWDISLHLHACQYWSLFAAVYDLTSPAKGGATPVERTWAGGLAVRPLGRDFLTITADNLVGERTGNDTLRLSLEFEPVRGIGLAATAGLLFGRDFPLPVSGGYGLKDVQVSIAIRIDMARMGLWSAFQFSAKGHEGASGFGGTPLVGWSVGIRLSGEKHATILAPHRYVVLDLSGATTASGVLATVLRAQRLERDGTVDGVILETRDFSATPGVVQDLREALDGLREKGKQVVCRGDEYSGSAYYLCTAADRIYVGPAGGVRLSGYKMRLIYYTGLLRKLGVNVEMVKIGKYKSYPEQFTLSGPSEDSIEEHAEVLAGAWKTLVEDVAAGRGRDPAEMEEILGRGPFNAQEAHEAGLVDGVAYPDEVPEILHEDTGKAVQIVESYWSVPWKPEAWVAGKKRVGVIVVDGGIVEGKSKKIPLLNIGMAGDETLVDTIDAARTDPSIAAVVLRVESGGGSAVASDRIWRAVQKLAEKKPVVASLGGEAASGGYYIVAPATEVWANSSTITGSIGLFYGKADLSGLLAKLDLSVAMLKEGGSKSDMESWHRPYTPEEIAYLEEEVNHFYNIFLERVAAGREKTREEVDAVGQGRIWTGEQAKDLGLVDGIGGLPSAIRRARALGKVPSWVPVVDLTPGPGLLGKIVGMLSGGSAADPSGIVDLAALVARTAGLDAVYPTAWIMLREEETPAALSPLTIEMD